MSRLVTSLCALPSFGASGTPTLFGGASASTDAGSPIDVTPLDRSTWPPGTALPSTQAARKAAVIWNITEAVWFDGNTALYGLSKHSASSSFSASYWFNPYTEETSALTGPQTFGGLFANSEGVTTVAPDGTSQLTQFRLQYTSNPPISVVGLTMPTIHDRNLDPLYSPNVGFSILNSVATGFATDPIDEMEGWCHIMYSHHVVSGQVFVNIFVNDTAILNGYAASHTFHNTTEYFDETFVFPWNVADFTSFDNTFCPWTVGGTQFNSNDGTVSNTDFTLPREGNRGLIGALTEVWIAPGQYVDWSSSANRAKFHSTDLTSTVYAPTDIGKDGATPTGTKPQFYFTGGPDVFPINRATGKSCAVFHNSDGVSLMGTIGKINPYNVIPDTH